VGVVEISYSVSPQRSVLKRSSELGIQSSTFQWIMKINLCWSNLNGEPGQLCRYRNWLRAGRPDFYSRQRKVIILHFTVTRPTLVSTQRPVRWI
jgi:hypothetical protein